MKIYNITYYINDNEGCGCSDHDHDYEHHEGCGCGIHEKHDDHECGCGGHSHKEYEDSEPKIQAKIRSFGAWAQIMPESFIVKSELNAEEMYNELETVSNKGDLLFVSCISADDTAYSNPGLEEWLKK